ncbi:MAG: peroxiredoxin [Bacteroidetes bacterium]|nr:peroxiredoxin [Rhodothermia bacterium]MCS7155139.1 peroxiredoxin [Bacteroidota bacterium]MCX7907352.1 peroxiredoxin [Bacteroidota bacterium]MDW8137921.1 peroxiredoxin [Bacteroidota bacterium]MDW8286228.1 peroxiredoxin [Bacteroidota bacterium]
MAVQVGQPAPDFTLYNTERQPVTLSQLRGKPVVLLFFPGAWTSVCTQEMCMVRDSWHEYEALAAHVLGISVDSPFALARFKADHNLPFELLSDFNKEVSRLYGTYREDFILGMKGVSNRAAFVVDPNGIVRYAEVLDNPGNLPDFASLKQAVSTAAG